MRVSSVVTRLQALMFTAICLGPVGLGARDDPAATVTALDAHFWAAYNACDTPALAQFFTRDVEFYHDKGGPTVGVDALVNEIRTNLCAGRNRVRREPVPESVHIALLRKEQTVYDHDRNPPVLRAGTGRGRAS